MSIANMVPWYARKPSGGQHPSKRQSWNSVAPLSSNSDTGTLRPIKGIGPAFPSSPFPLELLPWSLQCAKTLGRKLPSPWKPFWKSEHLANLR